MTGWRYDVALAIFIAGIISWCATIVPFVRVLRELARARRVGEADHVPFGSRGLPLAVVFTKNILPNAETNRRLLVRFGAAFVFFWVFGMGFIFFFGPHPH